MVLGRAWGGGRAADSGRCGWGLVGVELGHESVLAAGVRRQVQGETARCVGNPAGMLISFVRMVRALPSFPPGEDAGRSGQAVSDHRARQPGPVDSELHFLAKRIDDHLAG